jgi:hypothetical protein
MTTLAPCPGCRRHLRTDEPGCRFCGRSFTSPLVAPIIPPSRFTRIAAIALATGLGTGLEACSNQAMYGAPTGDYGTGGDGAQGGAGANGDGGVGGELNVGGTPGVGGAGGEPDTGGAGGEPDTGGVGGASGTGGAGGG